MKKHFAVFALCLTVLLIAGTAHAAKRIMLYENGSRTASSNLTETSDGFKVCSQTTPTMCTLFSPAASSGTTTLLTPYSASSQTTGLTSAVTGSAQSAVTSGPTLTIEQPGTFTLSGIVVTAYSAATFSTAQGITCEIYRTNNTPGAVSYTLVTAMTPSVNARTAAGPTIVIPPTQYTTTASDDTLKAYCAVEADPTAGALNVTSISLSAVRFK